MDSYQQLADCLHTVGIDSHFQNHETFVVSGQNPAMPDSNSFWVTKKGEEWFIGTWLPAVYKANKGERICEICEAVFKSSSSLIWSIEVNLVAQLDLRRLTPAEMKELGF